MAPRSSQTQRRTTQSQNEHVYELGKVGRKTGIVLDERDRDEHGLEEIDGMFSSPEKEAFGVDHASDAEQTMEIDDGSDLGPATTRKLQQRQTQNRLSIPRARSPIKTNLQSPARQNPHLEPASSPVRGSVVGPRDKSPRQAVARRLDFSTGSQSDSVKPLTNGRLKVNGVQARNGKLTNGRSRSQSSDDNGDGDDEVILQSSGKQRADAFIDDNADEQEEEQEEDEPEESMQMIDAADDHDDDDDEPTGQDDVSEDLGNQVEDQLEEQAEEEGEGNSEEEQQQAMLEQLKSAAKPKTTARRGRPKRAAPTIEAVKEPEIPVVKEYSPVADEDSEPVKKKRGRRPRVSLPPQDEPEPKPEPELVQAERPRKRGRPARDSSNLVDNGEAEQPEASESRGKKRQRTEKADTNASIAAASSKLKATAREEKARPTKRRKSSGVGVDSPVVQRGPPLPRSRGLVTMRREAPDGLRVTRSGRHSYKPLQFWSGERVEYGNDRRVLEDKAGRFVTRDIEGIVRAEQVEEDKPKKRRGRPGAAAGRGRPARIQEEEEEEERDDWEYEPGRIVGDCVYWYPEHETSPPDDDDQVDVVREELAISEPAVQLRDIKDATFKFAKTLTLPFFGAGIVDLPPGSQKRPKNAKKMQMAFFVHCGSVTVTVGHTTFKIAKGGNWFVPRGNHYSIRNETDRPARLFFAQGCEFYVQRGFEEDDGGGVGDIPSQSM